MANVVQTVTEYNGSRKAVLRWDAILDTSHESAVKKIDVSTLTAGDGSAPAYASILAVDYDIGVGIDTVTILFDATTDDEALVLSPGQGNKNFEHFGGITNPQSTGYTGDISLTTTGTVATDCSYQILITLKLHY